MSDSLRVVADSVASTMAGNCSTTAGDFSWICVFIFIHSFVFLIALFEISSFVIGFFRKKKGMPNETDSPENRPQGLIKELLWVLAIILSGTVVSLLSDATVLTDDYFSRLLVTMGVLGLCVAIFLFTKFTADTRNRRRKGLWVYIDKFFKELLWVFALIYASSWITTEFIDICGKTNVILWYTWKSAVARWAVDLVITSIIAVKIALVILKYKKYRKLSHSKD